MKKQTHPHLTQSLIQMKDGATYTKRWLYFRPSLPLEIDISSHILWKKNQKSMGSNRSLSSFKKLTK